MCLFNCIKGLFKIAVANNFFNLTSEYSLLFFWLLSLGFISIILLFISFVLLDTSLKFKEKLTPYECGFVPFNDARGRFEVHYYIVALLFMLFDVEIVFLLPWILILYQLDLFCFIICISFILILTLGLAFEWIRGALNW